MHRSSMFWLVSPTYSHSKINFAPSDTLASDNGDTKTGGSNCIEDSSKNFVFLKGGLEGLVGVLEFNSTSCSGTGDFSSES